MSSLEELRDRLDRVLALADAHVWLVLGLYLSPEDLGLLEPLLDPPEPEIENSWGRYRGFHVFHESDFARYELPWVSSSTGTPFTSFSREILGVRVHFIECEYLEGDV